MPEIAKEAATQEILSLLSLRNASFSVDGKVLLHPIDLDITAGKSIALIGHNGSGKSTLLKLLGRQQSPSSGSIYFHGKALKDWNNLEFARKLAYMPQRPPSTPGMLVKELVELGRYPWHGALGRFSSLDKAKVEEAIELTGIGKFCNRMVDNLSGGERQRVWLAMLVAQDASCLLLDEPISALDIRHQIDGMSLTEDLCHRKGISIITVIHDINMASRYCDEIIAIHSGRLIASGTPKEIMRPTVLKSIYDVDMEVSQHTSSSALFAMAV